MWPSANLTMVTYLCCLKVACTNLWTKRNQTKSTNTLFVAVVWIVITRKTFDRLWWELGLSPFTNFLGRRSASVCRMVSFLLDWRPGLFPSEVQWHFFPLAASAHQRNVGLGRPPSDLGWDQQILSSEPFCLEQWLLREPVVWAGTRCIHKREDHGSYMCVNNTCRFSKPCYTWSVQM